VAFFLFFYIIYSFTPLVLTNQYTSGKILLYIYFEKLIKEKNIIKIEELA